LPIVALPNVPAVIEKAYPISTQIATRHNALGEGTGLGIGDNGDPAYTLQQAHAHAVGIHISYDGDINTADTAYSLTTNGTATGRNGPINAHEKALGITAKGNGECFVMPECHYTLTHGGGQPGQGFPAALIQCAFSLDSDSSNSMKSSNPLSGCREVETARTIDTTNPCPSKNQGGVAVVCSKPCTRYCVHPKVVGTLTASASGMNRPGGMGSETDLCIVVPDGAIPINDKATRHNGGGDTRLDDGAGNGLGVGKEGDPAPTITSGDRHAVAAYCLQGNMIGRQDHNGPRGNGINEEVAFTLTATDVCGVTAPEPYQEVIGALCNGDHKGVGNQYVSQNKCIVTKYLVRRLTPIECERLQGYPDGWTEFGHDGKEISDTRRYQMLGNSVAVNVVAYIMQSIAAQFNKNGEGVKVAE
jgi:DNA (cytosine-5)-methyltransferase 1